MSQSLRRTTARAQSRRNIRYRLLRQHTFARSRRKVLMKSEMGCCFVLIRQKDFVQQGPGGH